MPQWRIPDRSPIIPYQLLVDQATERCPWWPLHRLVSPILKLVLSEEVPKLPLYCCGQTSLDPDGPLAPICKQLVIPLQEAVVHDALCQVECLNRVSESGGYQTQAQALRDYPPPPPPPQPPTGPIPMAA